MAAERTMAGLQHPTVVPKNSTSREHEEHTVHCPACGQPLAEH